MIQQFSLEQPFETAEDAVLGIAPLHDRLLGDLSGRGLKDFVAPELPLEQSVNFRTRFKSGVRALVMWVPPSSYSPHKNKWVARVDTFADVNA